jgi:hypothetical protein
MLHWLRNEANMRSAAIVGAVEYGRAHKANFSGAPTPRQVLDSVLQRGDEPGEALGYWVSTYGRPFPHWFKRALGDAAERLYTPYNVLKYDGQGQPVRFGDVLQVSDLKGHSEQRFRWILDRRYGNVQGDYEIAMLRHRRALESISAGLRRNWLLEQEDPSASLREAGMTWESVSGWIQGPMDRAAWEATIPSMGYMALLRNLRNFDEAGVSDQVAQRVASRLTDPEQVAKSKQLPLRFYSAYRAAPSDRWKHPLGIALDLSLGNVPKLGGDTLILADMSDSMVSPFSADSTLARWQAAALFGLAFARAQGETEVVAYSSADTGYWNVGRTVVPWRTFHLTPGANVLSELARWEREGYFLDNGTDTYGAVRTHFAGHDRILLLTDEQANRHSYDGVFEGVPQKVPCYTVNLAGYRVAHASSSPTRITVGGLSDKVFSMLSMVEKRAAGSWPWKTS